MKPELPTSEIGLLNSHMQHLSSLDISAETTFVRQTGIICTIGPASRDVNILEEMLEAGMNIARLNFSHGTHDYHAETIKNIRKANENFSKRIGTTWPLAIALDTKASEIRAGKIAAGEVELQQGQTFKLTNNETYRDKGDASIVFVDSKDFLKKCKPGQIILIDDGGVSLICKSTSNDTITCTVESTAVLGSFKGVNLPGVEIERPAELTDRDKADIQFAVEHDLDFIFASFTSSPKTIREIRRVLGTRGKDILIVAKVENLQGVRNLDEIIDESDGVMVERGDLGSEIPTEKVFLAQKSMIARCNRAGKAVICATQLLESMTERPRPTRAESSDVANAVMDGADCVMLSGETAKGQYPVLCVKTMASICKEAEAAIWQTALFNDLTSDIVPPIPVTHAIAISAVEASLKSQAKAIIVLTLTGRSAKLLAKYRPKCPIIAITTNMKVARQCHLHRGLLPIYYPAKLTNARFLEDLQDHIDVGVRCGKARGFLKDGDSVVTVTGWKEGSGHTNTIHVSQI